MGAGCSGTEAVTDQKAEKRSLSDLEELYWARIDSSRMNFTQADVDFMTGMIAHHAQALIMSRLAPENGASQSVQTLAARIINAQQDEINLMQKWLKVRGQPVPEVHIEGLHLMIHSANGHGQAAKNHHHDMPGMLTQEQLRELSEAKDREFDRLFLQYMIDHHMGAVVMVRDLFDTDGAGLDEEAFRLASDIHVDQITEIDRMRLMLEEMY
ncbi:MAG: DUF305 domain-containing protein [Balneolaceae bacterium]